MADRPSPATPEDSPEAAASSPPPPPPPSPSDPLQPARPAAPVGRADSDVHGAPVESATPNNGLVELPATTRGFLLLYALVWYLVLLSGIAICAFALPGAMPYVLPVLLMAPILLRAGFAPQRLSGAIFHQGWAGFGKSALEGLVASALLPLWLGGVVLLVRLNADWAQWLVAGEDRIQSWGFQQWGDFLGGMAAVAIGEELFFRGFLQHELSLALADRPRLGGWRLGRGYLLATVLFGVTHTLTQGGAGLLTFFPALIFGWLYARRRQVVGPAIFHFSCNILVAVATKAGWLA